MAAENGIPIVAFDSGSDYKNIQAMCSANNSEIGKTGAAKLASIVDDAGDVALFVHDKESTSAKQREAGFLYRRCREVIECESSSRISFR